MKYLFFDIECANCFHNKGKICEFGYVLTDDKFIVLDKKNYIINPNDIFDPFVIDELLEYKPFMYRQNKMYPFYYYKIKELINKKDITIVGHTIDADAGYLNDESNRYNLPFLNYDFYDVKIIYNEIKNQTNSTSVGKICDELNIPMEKQAHNALNDAEATKNILKELCRINNKTPEEFLSEYPNAKGNTQNGKITTNAKENVFNNKINRVINSNMWIKKRKIINQFLDGVKKPNKIIPSELNGKSISMSINYECSNIKEVINIIKLLIERGCEYRFKATSCDYFVIQNLYDDEGVILHCSRREYVEKAIEEGANIKLITFEQLLHLLDITEEELLKLPMPDQSNFLVKSKHKNRGRKRNNKKEVNNTEEIHSTTNNPNLSVSIGESQGQIFSEVLKTIE